MKHKEAYYLMQYRDEVTGEIEILWNSRDGVVPFIIKSKDGNKANHVNWMHDKYDPFYKPKTGDRIFVDAKPDLVRPAAIDYVGQYWGHSDPTIDMKNHPHFREMTMQDAIEYFIKEWCRVGQPYVLTVTDTNDKADPLKFQHDMPWVTEPTIWGSFFEEYCSGKNLLESAVRCNYAMTNANNMIRMKYKYFRAGFMAGGSSEPA